ncbi:MAG: TIGR04086 family membrane protein [Eubacteriales bacterium]|nr:TIGR04086 family membrane protein [Eubacteriales bacterium]
MRKTNESQSPAGILLPGGAVGLLMTLVLMLAGAVLLHRGSLPEGATPVYALGSLAVGCALAALIAAKRAAAGKLLWALGAGGVVFLILLAAGAGLLAQPVDLMRTASSLLCAMVASVLGGLAGAGLRPKKRYRHIKK